MPTWLKILLILAALGAVGLGTCVGGVAYWANANKDRLIDGTKTAATEGEAFGRGHSKDECVDDALSRVKGCAPLDFVCETMDRVRLASCMGVAAGGSVCNGAPGPTEIVKSATWASDECARRGEASDACGRVMQSVVQACGAAPRRRH
jgi:hypothetical protein